MTRGSAVAEAVPGLGMVRTYRREWLISDDPHHGWVRQSWEGQDVDPRLPFGA